MMTLRTALQNDDESTLCTMCEDTTRDLERDDDMCFHCRAQFNRMVIEDETRAFADHIADTFTGAQSDASPVRMIGTRQATFTIQELGGATYTVNVTRSS
jgi:hypothetical protein